MKEGHSKSYISLECGWFRLLLLPCLRRILTFHPGGASHSVRQAFKGVLDLPGHPRTRMIPCLLVDVICANVFHATSTLFVSIYFIFQFTSIKKLPSIEIINKTSVKCNVLNFERKYLYWR